MADASLPSNDAVEKRLKWSLWWVTHKLFLRKVLAAVIGVTAAVLVAYGGYGFLDWFFGSGVRERAQIAQLARNAIDFAAFRQANAPASIIVEDPIALGADGSFDIASRASNPNLKWWVEFNYRIAGDANTSSGRRAYLLPGETKYLPILANKNIVQTTGVRMELSDMVWRRVNNHVVQPDYPTWSNARLNIVASDIAFSAPAPTDPVQASRVAFSVKNDTGFSYYEVGFVIALMSGSRVVGINQVTISNLRAGERRTVDAAWFQSISGVTRVEIKPEINIFDSKAYIPPGN